MTNFVQRTLSGSVYVAVIVAAVLLHPVAFTVVFGLVSIFTVREFCKLQGLDRWLTLVSSVSAGVLFLSKTPLIPCGEHVYMLYLAMVIVALVAELFRKQENPIRNWGHFLTSQVLIAVPYALMNGILFHEGWETGKYVLLALFVIIWTNDTGAYCVGSLIGKHKMIPRVSPGKTWEGLIGGVVFALLAGYIFSIFVPFMPIWKWLVLAGVISIAGTLGDLMESIFKRTIGIKDSGNVVPGRGGFLDCFDSMLLATSVVALLLEYL